MCDRCCRPPPRFRVLVFDSIAGEPETATFVEWCSSIGAEVAVPTDSVDPAWPDVGDRARPRVHVRG